MVMMVSLYIIAGIHAAWFMGTHVNAQWNGDFLEEFERAAYSGIVPIDVELRV